MRKDIRKCISLGGYRIRFADQNEIIENLKES
jgi:hypothetical protein